MSKPNVDQQKAIDAPSTINVLINAGAGSGKTATLSDRVFRLIDSNLVSASSILILTFTNKAAYEMKQRIIQEFAEKDPTSLQAKEILSAHIQTFDSFSQYLVTTYAADLGISKNVQIANDSIITAKRRDLLSQILMEYYTRHDEQMMKTLVKFNTKDDKELINIILEVDDELQKIVPSKRDRLLNNYDEERLSRPFFDACVKEYVDIIKKKLREGFYHAYYLQEYGMDIFGKSANDLNLFLSSMKNVPDDYRRLIFNFKGAQTEYPLYIDLMELEGEAFLKKLPLTIKALGSSKRKAKDDDSTAEDISAYKYLHKLITTKSPTIKEIQGFDWDVEREYHQLLSFRDDIHLILDIVKELDDRLWDYKKVTNSFTFSDISGLALRLLTDKNFEHIAEEIRNRFTYIMVDEYQDTNDFQEEFLDSIRKHGHLFCVGDPKQSIYAFRNSNVKLFNAREAQFESDPDSESQVISMNTNYRSTQPILHDINKIFLRYMTKDHGDIDFTLPSQQLNYDTKVNLYPLTPSYYGISRIIYSAVERGVYDKKKMEAIAIIEDIKKKINNSSFQIYDLKKGDKEKHLRRVTYSDFAILIRKKKNFAPYQELFNEAGIPLDNKLSTNLREVDAIIFLESLIKFISATLNETKANFRHLFASLARSYVYGPKEGYDDEKIHQVLTTPDALKKDRIVLEIEEFCKSNMDRPFSSIFLSMLSTFHVIDKLDIVGDVEDNISKIESLYSIVLAQESAGEGLKEFVELFKSFNKYALDLSSETVLETENAVKLMTIHASKGLEFPVVYMPIVDNCMSGENNMSAPDFEFSKNYGILLHDYLLDEDLQDEEGNLIPSYTKNMLSLLYKKTEGSNQGDVDEHVRLFYVALTRAKDSLIFVGNDVENKRYQPENIYRMLDKTPHHLTLDESYIKAKIEQGIIKQEDYDDFLKKQSLVDHLSEVELTKTDFYNEEVFTGYKEFYENEFLSFSENVLEQRADSLIDDIFNDFLNKVYTLPLETKLQIYGLREFGDRNVRSLADLKRHENEPDQARLLEEPEKLDINLNFYFRQIEGDNYHYFFHKDPPKTHTEEQNHKDIRDLFFDTFMEIIDDFHRPFSYITYPYVDKESGPVIFEMNDDILSGKTKAQSIKEVLVSDNDIEFEADARTKRRASKLAKKEMELVDEEKDDEEKLLEQEEKAKEEGLTTSKEDEIKFKRGTYLHHLLEMVDFKTKDTSFICYPENAPLYIKPNDKALMDKILALPIFKDLDQANIYQEYSYYDEIYHTNGSIDLLIQKGDKFIIVDYKTNHIDDPDYINQLKTYQRNIVSLFKTKEENVSMYLLSINQAKLKEVK